MEGLFLHGRAVGLEGTDLLFERKNVIVKIGDTLSGDRTRGLIFLLARCTCIGFSHNYVQPHGVHETLYRYFP